MGNLVKKMLIDSFLNSFMWDKLLRFCLGGDKTYYSVEYQFPIVKQYYSLTSLIPTKNETGSIRADAAGGVGGLLDQTPKIANKAVNTAGAPITTSYKK